MPLSEIGAFVSRDKGTVNTTLRRAKSRSNGHSMPRHGRPQEYSARDRRSMLRNLRLHPKLTFKQRQETTGLKMSASYIKDLARANGLAHWRTKKRPELSEAVAAKRLLWCRCRAGWDVVRWREVAWSDECSVERGSGKEQVWVWGTPVDK
jgi:transposase